ncbi:MAG: hypothetical protein KDA45_14250 [Planctomycetales bacterium]|nr:hypothetical protein [Planctomycetales bacterium]
MSTNKKHWPAALACAVAALCSGVGQAQVVQLPSYRSFSYRGAASIPDGGTGTLGGTGYSATSRTSRGFTPWSSRASGSRVGGTSLTASVQIIDLQAMDEALLAIPRGAAAGDDTAAAVASTPPDFNAAGTKVGAAVASTAEDDLDRLSQAAPPLARATRDDPGRWQRVLSGGGQSTAATSLTAESDIRFYLSRGREAEQAGSLLAARVYYKMAMDAMTPELLDRYHRAAADRQAADKAAEQAEKEKLGRIRF